MEANERCVVCGNQISKSILICPHCGNVINKERFPKGSEHNYHSSIDKNIEYLEQMDNALYHLEQELDAFLCKKR